MTAPIGATQAVIDDLKASMNATYSDHLLTYAQASDVLGISRYTLSRLIRTERLTRAIHGGRYFITRQSVADYIAAMRRPSTAPQPTVADRRTA